MMTNAEIQNMVASFLRWRLPADFAPDGGISFKPVCNEHTAHPMRHEPTGTNLFTATQAEAMIRHILAETPRDATAVDFLLEDICAELIRARTKFPGDNVTMLALMEEVGELAKATFEEPRANVRKEAVQVAVMAIRVVLDGDATLNEWRRAKGLDRLTP